MTQAENANGFAIVNQLSMHSAASDVMAFVRPTGTICPVLNGHRKTEHAEIRAYFRERYFNLINCYVTNFELVNYHDIHKLLTMVNSSAFQTGRA